MKVATGITYNGSSAAIANLMLSSVGFNHDAQDFFGCRGYNPVCWVNDSAHFAKVIDALEELGVSYRIDCRIADKYYQSQVPCTWKNGKNGMAVNFTGHCWVTDSHAQRLGVAQVFDLLTKNALEECVITVNDKL